MYRSKIWSSILLLFAPGERRWLLGIAALSLAVALAETVGVGAVLPFVRYALDPAAAGDAPVLGALRASLDERAFVALLAAMLVAAFALKNAFVYWAARAQQGFLAKKRAATSASLFAGYLRAPYEFHLQNNSALLLRNVNRLDEAFTGLLQPSLVLLTEGSVALAVFALTAWLEPQATFAALLVVSIPVLLMYRSMRKRIGQLGEANHRLAGSTSKLLLETLRGVKMVAVSGAQEYFARLFHRDALRLGEIRRELQLAAILPRLVVEPIVVLGLTIVVLWFAFSRAEPGSALPLLALFGVASIRITAAVARILPALQQLRFNDVLHDTVIPDLQRFASADGGSPGSAAPGSTQVPDFPVVLDEVCYRYPGAERMALDRVSLSIGEGSSVALVGVSGSGKSTLMDLLLGVLRPTLGTIVAGGVPLASGLAAWRKRIGYIPQHIALLDDSLRRNIAFGMPDEAIDDGAVWKSLELAHLDGFVRSLPQGIDTPLGEQGARLSGGQRQRVSIARALYSDPALLLLDEATSALDPETEREVNRAFAELARSKTIVVIAHRMRTVLECRLVVWLEDGRIAAQGSFDELCERNDRFRAFAHSDAFSL